MERHWINMTEYGLGLERRARHLIHMWLKGIPFSECETTTTKDHLRETRTRYRTEALRVAIAMASQWVPTTEFVYPDGAKLRVNTLDPKWFATQILLWVEGGPSARKIAEANSIPRTREVSK